MGPKGFHHIPVLVAEAIDALAVCADGIYLDLTAGGGGHSTAIFELLGPGGLLVAFDRDPEAVAAAGARLAHAASQQGASAARSHVAHAPWSDFEAVLSGLDVRPGTVNGILADLGVSSHQIDCPDRGFSFGSDGPLDMRMDRSQPGTAADLVADLPESELARVLWELGDERDSRRIARVIVRRRGERPIATTADLAEVVSRAKGGRKGARIHPATRTFQALRMHLNKEREQLSLLLDRSLPWLRPGGRLALITFHSGEDRPVKKRLQGLARGCTCPPSDPICSCGKVPSVRLIHRGGVTASAAELDSNPRARSARLRAAERLDNEADRV